MIGRPIFVGAAIGLAGAVLMLPTMIDDLRALVDRREALVSEARALRTPPAALPPQHRMAGNADRALAQTAARVRRLARANGVLVEALAPATPAGPHLALASVALSGPEKAVLVVADAIERDAPGTRWRQWRLTAQPQGAVRIEGQVAVAWR